MSRCDLLPLRVDGIRYPHLILFRPIPWFVMGTVCYLHHHADPKRDFGPKIRTRRFLSVFDLTPSEG